MFVKFAFQERNKLSFCCRLKNEIRKTKLEIHQNLTFKVFVQIKQDVTCKLLSLRDFYSVEFAFGQAMLSMYELS